MFDISYNEFFSCLAIGAGIVLVTYALLQKSKKESHNDTLHVKDKITVRFVTKDLVWVTADIADDFTIYYTGQYKPGDKIKLIYNPKNPHEFVVETGRSEMAGRLLFTVCGLALFFGGIYSLFFTPLI